jgi:hypothetical protein
VALAICSGASAQQPHVSTNGRFQSNSDGAALPQRFTWASTTVYVPFIGDSITVALARVPNTGSSQFELRVDGHLQESATADSTQPKNITIPSLGAGMHTLAVTKITEALFGEALLTGVYVDQGGRCSPASHACMGRDLHDGMHCMRSAKVSHCCSMAAKGPLRRRLTRRMRVWLPRSFSARQVVVPGRRVEILGASFMNGYGDLAATMGCSDIAAVHAPSLPCPHPYFPSPACSPNSQIMLAHASNDCSSQHFLLPAIKQTSSAN